MAGHILLEGGAEFGGRMIEPDLQAIQLAGGLEAPIAVIPAAAAPDHNERRAGENGLRWFQSLGAVNVAVVPLFDPASARQPDISAQLQNARLIYLLGGFPGYLYRTLADSPSWQAILKALQLGAVLGGSSAGAMVLCEHFYDPETAQIASGLNLLPGTCLIPHHNTFGKEWAQRLSRLVPDDILIGIDEETGMLNNAPQGNWNICGKGQVTIYSQGLTHTCSPGDTVNLQELGYSQ